MLENLLEPNLLQNPLFVAFIVSLIVDIAGFLENKARKRGLTFDKGMLVETFFRYEQYTILLSIMLPPEHAVIGAFIIDVVRRLGDQLRGRKDEPT